MTRQPPESPLFPYTTLFRSAGKLVNAGVAVVSAPGVDNDVRDQMVATLKTAGATITSDVRLESGFVDPSQDATWGELAAQLRSEEHTSELQSHVNLVCRLLL